MPGPQVIFRDDRGRFLPYAKRYQKGVALIQAKRGGRYVDVGQGTLAPDRLVDVLSRREFEALPEATIHLKTFSSKKKYKAWDISEQIDKTKGIRRKELKFTVTVQDGKRRRQITVYHKIKRNAKASYAVFRRINDEMGFEKLYFYKTAGGKILADRRGKKVTLVKVDMEQVL